MVDETWIFRFYKRFREKAKAAEWTEEETIEVFEKAAERFMENIKNEKGKTGVPKPFIRFLKEETLSHKKAKESG